MKDEKDNSGNNAGNNGGSSSSGSNSGNTGSDDGNDDDGICLVTFVTNGGTVISAVYVNKGEKLTLPGEPVKEGVDFIGWYVDEELTDEFF